MKTAQQKKKTVTVVNAGAVLPVATGILGDEHQNISTAGHHGSDEGHFPAAQRPGLVLGRNHAQSKRSSARLQGSTRGPVMGVSNS